MLSSSRYLQSAFSLPGGHDVVQVDALDEDLQCSPLLDLLGIHSLGDSSGVSLDAHHETMGELRTLTLKLILLSIAPHLP